ncbi:MAG: aspartate aminotransferase family protein [Kiritimatiellaeota bacterium]|nr:aspartate aminotransferase family protein [Kiritimatiellota bacterium]
MASNNVTKSLVELQKEYLLPTYSPELLFIKGEGAWLWDDSGRKYLDFGSGIGVCSLGHSHPAVAEAIRRQVGTLTHISNLYMNANQPKLAEKLVKRCFDGAVFFGNSGAEANEGLIKLARKHGNPKGRFEIITMNDSFHGRTLATLAATGRAKYRDGFAPDMPGFKHTPFNDAKALAEAITPKTCAVLIEPIQGEGGVMPADAEFLQEARRICDEHEILLMFDEVQCGMGRTGSFFAWQHYGVKPDALSLAKALGNGFPIGAFIVDEKYKKVLQAGTHASTFGGTPLACAAAMAVLDTLEKNSILGKCSEKSEYIFGRLNDLSAKFECVREIRGVGLMIGIELDRPAAKLRKSTEDKALLTLTAGENVLRLLPPLNVTIPEIDKAVEIIEQALVEFSA